MYILIDRQRMSCVCKFPNLQLLRPEHLTPQFQTVELEDEGALLAFSLLELKLLYRSLGSVIGTIYSDKKSLVTSIRRLLKARLVVSPDQAALFPEHTAKTACSAAPTGRDRPVVNTVAPAKIPRSGNRAVIFEVADSMWEAAGKPIDLSLVLALRKTIMGELETAHHIKKTTSSTALGEWQKLRLKV